jgi:hypothetical protein
VVKLVGSGPLTEKGFWFVLRIRRVTRNKVKIYVMSDSFGADILVLVSVGDAVPVVLVHTALLTVVIVIIVTEGEVSRRGSRSPGASDPGPLGGPDLGLLLLSFDR